MEKPKTIKTTDTQKARPQLRNRNGALLPFKSHNSVGFLKLASPLYFRGHPYKKIISAILLRLVGVGLYLLGKKNLI